MASYGDDGVDLTELTLGLPAPMRARRDEQGREAGRRQRLRSFVKVSMDGTPYLRKVDVAAYGDYGELVEALNCMFCCASIGLMDGHGPWEHAVVYEDGDGDWMLVGDVPWEMFAPSCKRMRVMRACEARGLSSNA
ncbi:auxin-responsive protein IAA26-like isoform X2 [Phragmites australis]|uniref:auxin-responsive protein IAA26-like isoform X2 n=1 Tax=Phragmites australis TaxID=29695 RepID=UPI002D79EED0|nr:auxin-responsive protein IAA26-like isoform X2 [Phragmites australis]